MTSLSRANPSQAKFKSAVGGNLLQSWVNLTIVKIGMSSEDFDGKLLKNAFFFFFFFLLTYVLNFWCAVRPSMEIGVE